MRNANLAVSYPSHTWAARRHQGAAAYNPGANFGSKISEEAKGSDRMSKAYRRWRSKGVVSGDARHARECLTQLYLNER
jgi:hypothetical protein